MKSRWTATDDWEEEEEKSFHEVFPSIFAFVFFLNVIDEEAARGGAQQEKIKALDVKLVTKKCFN